MATPPPRRVLVVEDDPTINQALTDRLLALGYAVERASDGPGAVATFERTEPDIVLLDLMLPGFDGLEVMRRIQPIRPTPVLMLTARDEEADIVLGLGVGADDYLTKPFRMREVVARIEALLRRVDRARELASTSTPALTHDGLVLDPRTRRCTVEGVDVHLTPTEFDLLALLAADPGSVVRRERIVEDLWGWDETLGSRTLDSHVKAVRAKVGAHRVRTVHGVGYALAESEGGP